MADEATTRWLQWLEFQKQSYIRSKEGRVVDDFLAGVPLEEQQARVSDFFAQLEVAEQVRILSLLREQLGRSFAWETAPLEPATIETEPLCLTVTASS